MPETVQESFRLPRTVSPVRYDLHVDADPARPSFHGELVLHVQVEEPTDEVHLHAKGLTLGRALVEQEGRSLEATVEVDEEAERVVLRLGSRLRTGQARVSLSYDGTVSEGMEGLYLSKDGDETCLATQCEATDARRILPCMDEPDRKAVFALRVTAPAGLTVLANGAVEGRAEEDGRAVWTFKPVGPMSSYLLALCIGDFRAADAVTERGVPFRVWTLGGKEGIGTLARDLASEMLPWYEDYFGQPYAFGKYDQVAVPSFAFGAMENPGLVVFRPSLVLMDSATASWDDEKAVALVVAHEFAHMWFGDLVTMAWWDDLWLNEAFAEWMAHKIAHDLRPDLDVWDHFRQRASSAMSTDALERTHAIYHPIRTPAEAAEMFDAVTYGKGSAVMRMLEAFLGEEAFRDGLRAYMAEFRFGNAQGSDLWRHLGEASGQDVEGIMRDWILQAGHPVVACAWEDGVLRLRQQRARSRPDATVADTVWRVPLVIRYEDDAGEHVMRHLMGDRHETLDVPAEGRLRWLWPNADDMGFYRTIFDDGLLRAILEAPGALRSAERIALVRDLWLQVRVGDRDIGSFLDAFDRLVDGEAPYDVVQHTVGVMRELEGLLESGGREDALPALRAWVRARLLRAYRVLGAEPEGAEPPQTRERRASLLRAVGGVGRDDATVADARRIAAREREDPAGVDPDLAGTAVAVEAITGGADTLRAHLAAYQARRAAHVAPQDMERYLYVLPAFRGDAEVREVLRTLASGDVAPQAVGPILRGMLVQPHAQRAAWAFLREDWPGLRKRLGEAWIAILVEACGELPPAMRDEVVAFLDVNLEGTASQAYARAKERLAERAGFLPRVVPGIADWMAGHA